MEPEPHVARGHRDGNFEFRERRPRRPEIHGQQHDARARCGRRRLSLPAVTTVDHLRRAEHLLDPDDVRQSLVGKDQGRAGAVPFEVRRTASLDIGGCGLQAERHVGHFALDEAVLIKAPEPERQVRLAARQAEEARVSDQLRRELWRLEPTSRGSCGRPRRRAGPSLLRAAGIDRRAAAFADQSQEAELQAGDPPPFWGPVKT